MVIAPVFQRVDLCHRAGRVGHVAPGVVFVGGDTGGGEGIGCCVVGDLVQSGDVALLVGFVVVRIAIKVRLACCLGAVVHRQRSACGVVDEVHLVGGAVGRPRLAGDLTVLRGVLVGRCAAGIRHGLAGADAVCAVGIGRGFSAAGQAGKLAPVLPRQGVLGAVEVGQRVADRDAAACFVGNIPRRTVDSHAGEQVFPVAGVVVGERLRDIGAGDAADIAGGIVRVRHGVAANFFAQQLVLGVIGVSPLDGLFVLVRPRDRCNIPHRVVCVACAAVGPAGAEAGVGLAGNLRRRAGGGDIAVGVALGVEPRHGFAGQALEVIVGKRCRAARAEVGGGHGAVAAVVGVAPGVGFGGRFAVFCLEQGPALLFDAVGVVVEVISIPCSLDALKSQLQRGTRRGKQSW